MADETRVLIFGDQTCDVNAKLRQLLLVQSNPILTTFFGQAFYVIRTELGYLPVAEQKTFPKFNSIADLLSRQRRDGVNQALQTALSCIYQLGHFICRYGEVGRSYPEKSDTYLVGFCTGALAAAAIGCSKTLSELLPAAVQTVSVAFRLGLLVMKFRDGIEQPTGKQPPPWSILFPGLTIKKCAAELEEFVRINRLPLTSQPWISAYAPAAVTVSGPPSILQRFRESPALVKSKSKNLPIYVASHAGHLFTTDDVDAILEKTSVAAWASYIAKIPTYSCATGRLVWAGNLRSQLHAALRDTLCEPIRLDKVLQELPLRLQTASNVKITPIGTNLDGVVRTAIDDLRSKDQLNEPSPSVTTETLDQGGHGESMNVPCGKSKLAIVGMSGRFPDADSPEEFWELLYRGLDVCREVPRKRWDIRTHVDPTCTRKGTGATPWGCWLKEPGLFDARFFSISPKEAPQMDPSQRLSLMVTYEAMEHSGIVPGTTPSTMTDRIGVFHGATGMDWAETNASQDIDTYYIPGGIRAFIAGRINFCFEFCGPSYTNDTACSSALAAIHLACNSLWRHDVDTAIASASNSISNPDGHAGLDRGFFLSRTGNCKTFDDQADGYCRSEGVGTVIIKRLEDAIADNDPILAVILDAKTNHSAESESMTRPYGPAQEANMDMVLSETGVDPSEISYIEVHGTGTQVGDAIEMTSVLDIFAPVVGHRGRSDEEALYLGSAKANIGHSEGSSGMMSLAKILLMLKNNTIVPHCGIKPGHKINRNYPKDLAERNVRIAQKPVSWNRPQGRKRKVLINNFSAPGGNTAVIIEDAPLDMSTETPADDLRSTHMVSVSAKCAASLKGNMQSLLKYLQSGEDENLSPARLSYTTTARRLHHLHRAIVSGSSIGEITSKLEEALARGDGMNRPKSRPQVFFAFTGQGSQYLGMGKQLYEAFSDVRSNIRRFDQLARRQGFPSFQPIFTTTDGNINEFTPVVVQLAITCMQIAIARLWMSWGITPLAVVGHSLGEYAALNIAGVLSESDMIYLVGKRAVLLQEGCQRGTHAMLAVKASTTTISGFLGGQQFEAACINGPDDTVLGGTTSQIEKFKNALAAHKLKTKALEVPYAFHTSQVDPILDKFETIAGGVIFHKPSIPVLSPLLGKLVSEAGLIGPKYLVQHCRQTVNMRDALKNGNAAKLINDKSYVIEIGPQPVVSGMIKATLGDQIKAFPTLQRGQDTWKLLTAAVTSLYANGLDIKWCEYHRDFKAALKVLHLPAYSWDLKEYWIPYVGDWCLRRGEILPGGYEPQAAVTEAEPAKTVPKVENTTIHQLVEETVQDQKPLLIFESDFSRVDLNGIAKGHQVNGIPLTTPSVYAEMALTVGTYMLDRFKPEMTDRLVNISDMLVEKALIPHSQGPQLLRISAKIDWASMSAACVFYSVNDKGKTNMKHAWCTLKFTDRSQLPIVQKRGPEYQSRIDALRQGIMTGDSLRYSQAAGYKLIATLAKFHPDYRAIDEVVLDSKTLEAYSVVNFGQVKKGGSFNCHPAYIDVLSQTAGFIMNGKDSTDLDIEIYVNHGWDSLQIFEKLSPDKSYWTYVRMEQADGSVFKGDTVMFDGDRVVAFFKGLALRGVSRNVFSVILASADRQNPKQAAKVQAKPVQTPAASASVSSVPSQNFPPKAEHTSQPPSLSGLRKPTTTALEQSAANLQKTSLPKATKKNVVTPALQIISEESGIALSDLTDDCVFADIGVDSLLSMVITSRFREELGLSLDLESSMFIDFPTVKRLRDYMNPAGDTLGEEEADTPAHFKSPASTEVGVKSASDEQAVISAHVETVTTQHDKVDKIVTPVTAEVVVSTTTSILASTALNIISEESGIALEELTDNTAFADIGVDSLLSMTITSRFREELALDLELDFSMFTDLPTVIDLKNFLSKGGSEEPDGAPSSESSVLRSGTSTPEVKLEGEGDVTSISTLLSDSEDEYDNKRAEADKKPSQPRSNACRPATSVILQGFPRTAGKTLFLLPDGGGSASSYVPIPKLNADVSIVGLNCPYARDSENMNCTITALMESYVTEIRRRQNHGPYHLGGWSSGGVFAYLATQKFISEGEEVEDLVIIDSPVPQLVDRLPTYFYEYCDQIGLFGISNNSAPKWLIPHFEASVDVLVGYQLQPLPEGKKMPKTSLIWACDSVLDGKDAPPIGKEKEGEKGSKGVHFLLEKRKDFGTNGWEVMLPGAEFVLEKVVGANHFSMMQKRFIGQIGGFIERAMK